MMREVLEMERIRAPGSENIQKDSLKSDLKIALFTVLAVGAVLVMLVLASQLVK